MNIKLLKLHLQIQINYKKEILLKYWHFILSMA